MREINSTKTAYGMKKAVEKRESLIAAVEREQEPDGKRSKSEGGTGGEEGGGSNG